METVKNENQLIQIVENSGLEIQTAQNLKESFIPFFDQAEEWKRKAEALVVTDANQVHDMKMARTARLALREIRINADKKRKELKEDSLRYGKAVQGVYNVIDYLISPTEKHLKEQEDFVAIQEAKRKGELRIQRESELEPYTEFIPYELDLGGMSEDDYAKTLNGAKLQLQQKIEAERKAEQERIAKEKAEAAERERIRLENEKLKAEAEAREKELAKERAKVEAERKKIEAKAKKEREEAEAKLKAEIAQKQKLEAEIKAREKAEEDAKKAQAQAEKKAKAAPDKAKLNEFAEMLDTIVAPEMKSEDAQKIMSDAMILVKKISIFVKQKTETL
jgi:hypothetical protein